MLTPVTSSAEPYEINNSIKYIKGTAALTRALPASADLTRGTVSAWAIPYGAYPGDPIMCCNTNNTTDRCWFGFGDAFEAQVGLEIYQFVGNVNTGNYKTGKLNSQIFGRHDFVHYFVNYDTNRATAADRFMVYVNGVRQPMSSMSWAQGLGVNLGAAQTKGIWTTVTATTPTVFNGTSNNVISEFHFLDGVASDISNFGMLNKDGKWVPKKYTGAYGARGFCLDFKEAGATSGANSGFGKDVSGNGNYFNTGALTVTGDESIIELQGPSSTLISYRETFLTRGFSPQSESRLAGINFVNSADTNYRPMTSMATLRGMKCYFEFKCTVLSTGAANTAMVGVTPEGGSNGTLATGQSIAYCSQTGERHIRGTRTAYGAAWVANDIIGVAVNAVDGNITFYKNGVSQGTITDSAILNCYVMITNYALNGGFSGYLNMGELPFAYAPPAGFTKARIKNMPESAIQDPQRHYRTFTYTGNGAASQVLTGGKFQPDLVIVKRLDAVSNLTFVDSVRGGNKPMYSNLTTGEATSATVDAWSATGFTANLNINANTGRYIAHCFKANGAAVANTDGTITTQVSANRMAGFSIVTFTGTLANATIGHGLGVAPKFVIVARRGNFGSSWRVYHGDIGATAALAMQSTAIPTTSATYWNNTAPTSTVVSLGTSAEVNAGDAMVAYCFAEIAGFSRFSGTVGNSNIAYLRTGFQSTFSMHKDITSAGDWILPCYRSTTGFVATVNCTANTNAAEVTNTTATNKSPLGILTLPLTPYASASIYVAFAEATPKNA